MPYVIGIDGGGTKTVAVLLDAAGRVLGRGEGGPSNYQTAGAAAVDGALRVAIAAAAAGATANERPISVGGMCLGMAGVDRPADRAALEPVMYGLVTRPPGGIRWVSPTATLLFNDAVVALVGGTGRKLGVVQVAGTGSIAYGMNERGEQRRAGGWGHVLGDEGSGYAIGRAGLQAVARAHDGRGPRSRLTELVLAHYRLQGPEQLIDLAYGTIADVAAAARLVDQAAAAGDEVAQTIIHGAAAELGLCATTVIRALGMEAERFDVVTTGGAWQGTGGLRDLFRCAVLAVAPDATVRPPLHEPAYGAALLALEAASQ